MVAMFASGPVDAPLQVPTGKQASVPLQIM
jgi:hypothetical protein